MPPRGAHPLLILIYKDYVPASLDMHRLWLCRYMNMIATIYRYKQIKVRC